MASSSSVREIRRLQRADGPAAVLAIGTANPPTCLSQVEYTEFYFRATNSEHLTDLKLKLKTFCKSKLISVKNHANAGLAGSLICSYFLSMMRAGDKTGTERRFFHHTQEVLDANPRLFEDGHDRLEIAAAAAPELAASAAVKAIAEWGRPATDITHLIVSTNSSARCPGTDIRLATLLDLRPSVVRTMLHLTGCHGGSASLRLAKDIAENNRGARVLLVCVELTVVALRGPEENYPHTLLGQASFGDGAGAVIVGADAVHPLERPLFEMVSASQTVIPGTDHAAVMKLGEGGLAMQFLMRDVVPIAGQNIEQCLSGELKQLGLGGVEWNDLFWAAHPGIRAILDHIDEALRLDPGKLAASRTVLREYGNMLSATVIFVLDEQRRRMVEDGEGGVWGVMMGFGPGFTIETMVLHATSNLKQKQYLSTKT